MFYCRAHSGFNWVLAFRDLYGYTNGPKVTQNEMHMLKHRIFVVQTSRGVKNDSKRAPNVFLAADFKSLEFFFFLAPETRIPQAERTARAHAAKVCYDLRGPFRSLCTPLEVFTTKTQYFSICISFCVTFGSPCVYPCVSWSQKRAKPPIAVTSYEFSDASFNSTFECPRHLAYFLQDCSRTFIYRIVPTGWLSFSDITAIQEE